MTDALTNARGRMIVALDLPNVDAARAMIAKLGDSVSFYKLGYQLLYADGFPLIAELTAAGKQVFVDLKLHDIGNTVAAGVRSIAKTGATFLTVHAYPQTMQAAAEARGDSGLKILAVTVLTSYDDDNLAAAGFRFGVADLVAHRAAQARDIGIDGLVCSPLEATQLRAIVGPERALVTPGVRPAGSAADDQKRIMTPARAIAAGSDYLVIGRPVIGAPDPKLAADAIVAEMAGATF